MSATPVVRHTVADYDTWRAVYDERHSLRAQHGCTAQRVMAAPEDANDLLITHDFGSVEQAGAFAHDPALSAGMVRRSLAVHRACRAVAVTSPREGPVGRDRASSDARQPVATSTRSTTSLADASYVP